MSNETIQSKPAWLRVRPPGGPNYIRIKRLLESHKLHTVCREALCPNVAECWGQGTATILLLGEVCTRSCRFCDVQAAKTGKEVDPQEPAKVAEAVSEMGLSYVVLTSVDRDDLPDGGAEHFAETVSEIKKRDPEVLVEVLIPDFKANSSALDMILKSGADVVGHNLETVERLTPAVRDRRCSYRQSLAVLRYLKDRKPAALTKSSLMLGLGETLPEVCQAMDDLRDVGVDILTLGQYLRPSSKQLPVTEYVAPGQFEALEKLGSEKGFLSVFSGPLVRSSYRAGEEFLKKKLNALVQEVSHD